MVSTQIITPATFTPWVESNRNHIPDPRFVNPGTYWSYVNVTPSYVPGGVVLVATSTSTGNMITAIPTGAYAALVGAPASVAWKVQNVGATPFSVEPRFWNGSAYTTGVVVTIPAGETRVVKNENKTLSGAYVQPRLWQVTPAVGGAVMVSEPILVAGATVPDYYFDGATFSTPTRRTSWSGNPDASPSIEETRVQLTPDIVGLVYEEVTLTSPDDSITFRALPEGGGFVYDNKTLQQWYAPADFEPDVDGRPNANGAYGLGQIFTAEHRPIIVGQYYGTDSIDAKTQRQRLIAMQNEGNPITMTVTDESGVATRREVWLVDYDAPFAADFSHFTFDLDFIAPDALRYGERTTDSTGMPTPGSGLVWNLGTAPSGLYFDWGTPGNLGQITLTNEGGAATGPIIEVGGPGTIGGGFRVTEIETGRELTFARALTYGDVVVLDSQVQNATLNGADVTGLMTSRKWFTIPRGATRRYQITPLGSVSGAPTITGYADAAWL